MSYNYYFDDDGDNGYVDDNDDVDGEKRENSILLKRVLSKSSLLLLRNLPMNMEKKFF